MDIRKKLMNRYDVFDTDDKLRNALILIWRNELKLALYALIATIAAAYFVIHYLWPNLFFTSCVLLVMWKYLHDRTKQLKADVEKTDDAINKMQQAEHDEKERASEKVHLRWIYDRMVNRHGENPHYDYMLKFNDIIGEKPFPRFWFEGNLFFDWVNNLDDLHRVFKQYKGHMTMDEVLDESHNANAELTNFGLRREHSDGKVTLREFLKNHGIHEFGIDRSKDIHIHVEKTDTGFSAMFRALIDGDDAVVVSTGKDLPELFARLKEASELALEKTLKKKKK